MFVGIKFYPVVNENIGQMCTRQRVIEKDTYIFYRVTGT